MLKSLLKRIVCRVMRPVTNIIREDIDAAHAKNLQYTAESLQEKLAAATESLQEKLSVTAESLQEKLPSITEFLQCNLSVLSTKTDTFCQHLSQEISFKTHIAMSSGNLPEVFAAFKNDPDFKKKLAAFSAELDEESRAHVELYIKKALILPRYFQRGVAGGGMRVFSLHPSTGLLSAEDYFMITNKDQILSDISAIYAAKYVLGDIPISLHVHYYNNGLIYVPDAILESLKETTAIDCGAWLGDTAIMLNDYGFTTIHCFEPNPSTFSLVQQNLACNNAKGNFVCHNKAVGNEHATLLMEAQGYMGGGSRIGEGGTLEVKCIVLDELFSTEEKIGLIKFDVEGFEENALRGAEKLIKKHRPVLLIAAYHEWAAPGQMFTIVEYVKSLNLGYTFMFRGMQPDYGLVFEYDIIAYVPQSTSGKKAAKNITPPQDVSHSATA